MPIRTAKTYFYPRSPCGERPIKRERGYYSYTFLSTLSLRRATRAWPNIGPAKWISIHALLAESDLYQHGRPARRVISIHALLAESDFTVKVGRSNRNISIHALLAESDVATFAHTGSAFLFLSTLSLRRATQFLERIFCTQIISIHALLAESDILGNPCAGCPAISIHALLAESDYLRLKNSKKRHNISIHALLAESDRPGITRYYPGRNFYPRSPCGERQAGYHKILPRPEFLSTLSLRRATSFYRNSSRCFSNFYPRSPCGERPRLSLSVTAATRFLPTLSLRRATFRGKCVCW